MELLYTPLTQCERSAYDSLWCRISSASYDLNNVAETLTVSEVFTYFKSCGLCDDDLLTHVGNLAIPNADSTSSDRFTKKRFYILMRALSIAQYSTPRSVSLQDIIETRYTDIPLFRFDRLVYSPSSTCERSAYEILWYRVNTANSTALSGDKVVSFAMRSGLQKGTLSKCWNMALEQSGRHHITKEEFFVFLRCISFVQVTGIANFTREHILSTACRDFPVPDLDRNDVILNSRLQTMYPTAFYFPATTLEISAYNSIWNRASARDDSFNGTVAASTENDLYYREGRISAALAVSFLVTSRLRRSILKELWVICSPTAGPFKETLLTREQFNTLLRGISLAQQFPSQILTAESISKSAMKDIKLPCFDFQTKGDSFFESNSSSSSSSTPESLSHRGSPDITLRKSSNQNQKQPLFDAFEGEQTTSASSSSSSSSSAFPLFSFESTTISSSSSASDAAFSSSSSSFFSTFSTATPATTNAGTSNGISYNFNQPSPVTSPTINSNTTSTSNGSTSSSSSSSVSGGGSSTISSSVRPPPNPPRAPPPPRPAPPFPPTPISTTPKPNQSPRSSVIIEDNLSKNNIIVGVSVSDRLVSDISSPLSDSQVETLVPLSPRVTSHAVHTLHSPPLLCTTSVFDNNNHTPNSSSSSSAVKTSDDVTWLSSNDTPHVDAHEKLCVCGDTVVRFRPDCVRLRCKCMIHTTCLALYVRSQLEDSSKVSGQGIRCCYWHACHSYITMDDVDKFSSFIGKSDTKHTNSSSSPNSSSYGPGSGTGDDTPGHGGNVLLDFGTNEVDKFTRFAVAASFEEKDLVYCPSCSTPFWVDEDFKAQRVVCLNAKCGVNFCRSCQVQWHGGMDCNTYQMSVASDDKLSHRYVAATSKKCPSCSTPFTHYHGHSCHHISPVGIKGGGCPSCHVHFCYACLSTAEENISVRGDRKSCKCAKGKWGTFCESVEITRYLIQDPYPHDSRCGCPICPDCRYQKPCGGLGYSGSSCDGTCVVCMGLVPPGPLEIIFKK